MRFWDATLEEGLILFDHAYLDQATIFFVGSKFQLASVRSEKCNSHQSWLVTWRASYWEEAEDINFSGITGGLEQLTCRDTQEEALRANHRFPPDAITYVISSID
jgi:hypothetical protein